MFQLTRSISIIIPAYNEEKRLPATIARVLAYLDQTCWAFSEVVLVDDGSTDSTAAIAQSFESRDARVRLLRNGKNRGKGYAVRQGMLNARADWFLLSDADLSAPIDELENLWTAVCGTDVSIAVGSRALDRSLIGIHQPAIRENAGRVFNALVHVITGLPFRDTQCGFKLFKAHAAREIFARQTLHGFGFDVEVLFIAKKLGHKATEIPVRWNNSVGTKVNMIGGLVPFVELALIRWNDVMRKYD